MAQSADQVVSPAGNSGAAGPALSMTEEVMHSTILLEMTNAAGQRSTGTGFLFLLFNHQNSSVPVIVTNRHVVSGASLGTLTLTRTKSDGYPDFGNNISLSVDNFESRWIVHPDPVVDLAVLPISSMMTQLENEGRPIFVRGIDAAFVPTEEQARDLFPMEDVIVVGYPDAISDKKNNVPVFRRGITATPFYLDFDGKREFLIDATIFPGSSGSPVFLLNQGSYASRNGSLAIGSRIQLLGIVFGVFTHTTAGEIRLVPAPTQMKAIALSAIPNNVGACIKSSRILEFEPLFVARGVKPPEGYKMREQRP